ncbi:MAG: methyltransferase domain-containing protein [Hyphomonadaceae bacterium]|nr:methyltransferase domain-containing protein [Hyphomonadaceae bacterium]
MMLYEAPSIDDRAVWDILMSMLHLPAVTAADEVGVFAALREEELTREALAARVGADARALGIVLGVLAGLGTVVRRDGRWRATPLSRAYLDPAGGYYWGGLLHRFKNDLPYHARLVELLKRAGAPSGHVEGWEAGQIPPDVARAIATFMHAHSLPAAIGAARDGDFAGVKKLLDVGGGSGVFSIAIAQRHPDMQASILELATMCEAAQKYIAEAGMDGRVDTVACDMFRQPWPKGYDATFFSNIFHDWPDDTCRELAKKAFDITPQGGRIYIHEQLMGDAEDGPLTTACFSLLMLLATKGKQYTLAELRGFLESAGYVDVKAIPTSPYYSLVSARKP